MDSIFAWQGGIHSRQVPCFFFFFCKVSKWPLPASGKSVIGSGVPEVIRPDLLSEIAECSQRV